MSRNSRQIERKKQIKSNLIFFGLVFIGIVIMLYPIVVGYINKVRQQKSIDSYTEKLNGLSSAERDDILLAARDYNEWLFSSKIRIDDKDYTDDFLSKYESTLNVNDDGMMGYISIPKIDVSIPIYHGSEEKTLQTGVRTS